MMVKVKEPDAIKKLIMSDDYEHKRIISISAHIDHGKTTTTDYLMRRAGLMSDAAAGQALMTDSDEEEQERGITIFTSVVLLNFEVGDEEYLVQLSDTPGHLSFTGEVSRALRASDGVVILVDALEGVMTQTETNIRLAVGGEGAKPVLFINKVDRLINELKLPPAKVYERIDIIIAKVNELIKKVTPREFEQDWRVSFEKGSVAIGSAKTGWAFTMKTLAKKEIKPVVVFEKYNEGDEMWLRENLPLDEPLLEMIVEHLPNPKDAQKYKIPRIWSGDLDSPEGKALLECDRNGPLLGMITKIFVDPKSKRPTLIGRVFSGTLKTGDEITLVNMRQNARVKRLGVQEITDILPMDEIPAGNLMSIFGFMCPSGETFVKPGSEMKGFEAIEYVSEPVVSRSISPVDPQDIAKLGEVVRKWIMADPTARFFHDKESGEYRLDGIDPLQIEILTKRIHEQVKIHVSEPIIVYREKIAQRGEEFHTKSPNGHNRLRIYLEPLDDKTVELIRKKKITATQADRERAAILRDEAGWDAKEARKILDIYESNMLVDQMSGVQRFDRIRPYVTTVFHEFCDGGPLAREPIMGVKAVITDATVHTDPAHTGYSEIATMTSSGLNMSFLTADPSLYEPVLNTDIKTPTDTQGGVIKVLTGHRGQVVTIEGEEENVAIKGTLPTAETIGIADEFRSATAGRSFFGYEFRGFEPLPGNMQEEVIFEIRERKGMPVQMPTTSSWSRYIYKRT
ncbi:MAG: elongation factor EF-2 [Candidatus Thorarchaeota archaeon]|nr:MAG: elongation factor EF-2 [Candidatus Thorarchaeota archaeon]